MVAPDTAEWEDARRLFPGCGVVNTKMLRSEKYVELCLPEASRMYKGRLVAQGNFVRDSSGKQIFDKCEHDPPVSVQETKILATHALRQEKPSLKQGDVITAYPKARLGGRKMFARIAKELRPKAWQQ